MLRQSVPVTISQPCERCGGTGTQRYYSTAGTHESPCPWCNASGYVKIVVLDEGQTTSPEGFAIWLRDQHDGYVETMADLRAARQRIAEMEGERDALQRTVDGWAGIDPENPRAEMAITPLTEAA